MSPANGVARCLVATDDDRTGAYADCREAGLALAEEEGAEVVLYDRSSESYLIDPYPVGAFSDERDNVSGHSALEPQLLRSLGRGYLAKQLEQARGRGLVAYAYLARGHGGSALGEAVARWHPDLVMLPSWLARPSLADRISGNTLDAFRRAIDVEILVVDPTGRLRSA